MFETGPSHAAALDAADPLQRFRTEFHHPVADDGSPITYLVGNSLGLQPMRTAGLVGQELDKWATRGVAGHVEGDRPWVSYHENLSGPLGALIGAGAHEVVAMNALTVNLHLLMISFYRPTEQRDKVLIEQHAFPSDHFAVESQIRQRGLDPAEAMVTLSPEDGEALDDAVILETIEALGDELAMVLLPGVQYYTGQVFDMAAITAAAHRVGAVAGFDLAHAIGNVPMDLHRWGADFAVWCSYKYLNAGPGAVGGAFVHDRHHGRTDLARFHGWWGHDKATRFEMDNAFVPISTVEAWQLSNPPILALAPLIAALEIFDEAGGIAMLRRKSEQMIEYLDFLCDSLLGDDVGVITPRALGSRGCQVSLQVLSGDGRAVFDALTAAHIECDWRYPDVIRAAPVPLYNTYADIERFVSVLAALVS